MWRGGGAEIARRVEDERVVSLIVKSSARKRAAVIDTKQEEQSGPYNDTNCQKNAARPHPRHPFIRRLGGLQCLNTAEVVSMVE